MAGGRRLPTKLSRWHSRCSPPHAKNNWGGSSYPFLPSLGDRPPFIFMMFFLVWIHWTKKKKELVDQCYIWSTSSSLFVLVRTKWAVMLFIMWLMRVQLLGLYHLFVKLLTINRVSNLKNQTGNLLLQHIKLYEYNNI